jgi:hypothetical protein
MKSSITPTSALDSVFKTVSREVIRKDGCEFRSYVKYVFRVFNSKVGVNVTTARLRNETEAAPGIERLTNASVDAASEAAKDAKVAHRGYLESKRLTDDMGTAGTAGRIEKAMVRKECSEINNLENELNKLEAGKQEDQKKMKAEYAEMKAEYAESGIVCDKGTRELEIGLDSETKKTLSNCALNSNGVDSFLSAFIGLSAPNSDLLAMASWKRHMENKFPALMGLCGIDGHPEHLHRKYMWGGEGRSPRRHPPGLTQLNSAFDVLTGIAISIIGAFHQTIANKPNEMVISNLCLLSGRGDWCYEGEEGQDFQYGASVIIANLLYITLWGCELQKTLPDASKNDQAMIETIDEMVRNKLTEPESKPAPKKDPINGPDRINNQISKRILKINMEERAKESMKKINATMDNKCPGQTGVFSFLFEARIICLMTGCSFKVVKTLLEGNEQTICMSDLHSEWVKNNDKDSQFMIDEIDDRNNMFAYARWQESITPNVAGPKTGASNSTHYYGDDRKPNKWLGWKSP